MMFYKPIRPYFSNQFFPILYSDLWGDYWGHFVFTSRDLLAGRNQNINWKLLGKGKYSFINTNCSHPLFTF